MKHLTGSARVVNVNKARYKLFCSKSLCEQRLLPNSDALFLHIKGVIYQSSIHRHAIQQFIQAMDGIWLINDPSSGWWYIPPHHQNWWSTSTTPTRNAGVAQTSAPAGHQMYPALTCVECVNDGTTEWIWQWMNSIQLCDQMSPQNGVIWMLDYLGTPLFVMSIHIHSDLYTLPSSTDDKIRINQLIF